MKAKKAKNSVTDKPLSNSTFGAGGIWDGDKRKGKAITKAQKERCKKMI